MSTHYIAMAGLHGYMPQYCASCETYADAVETLAEVHDLGRRRRLELNLRRDGNEYCEITECDCDNPDVHNDS